MVNAQLDKSLTEAIPPWYKQFWPWMLIALPGSVVVACIITITISVKYSDDLVVGDYYRAGIAINNEIQKQQTAEKFNISAAFKIDRANYDSGILQCELLSDHKIKSNFILLRFRHAINAEHDRTVMLNRKDKTQLYEAPFFTLAKGAYKLTIESSDKQWQLNHRLQKSELLEGLIIKS